MPYFRGAELKLVRETQRTFLSRHEFASPERYQLACNHALRELLGADHTIFFDVNGQVTLTSDDACPDTVSFIEETYARLRRGLPSGLDPRFTSFVHRRLYQGAAAFTDFEARALLEGSDTYHARFVPAGLRFVMGPSVATPEGEASVLCAFEGLRHRSYSEHGLRLLELTIPAFRAGVEAQRASADVDLERLLSASRTPTIIFSAGAEVQRNDAFTQLESTCAHPEKLWGAAAAFAAKVGSSDETLGSPRHHVRTPSCSYELTALLWRTAVRGTQVVLVVTRTRRELPGPGRLCSRHGLTARQAQVALLVAEGLTDKQVAARLGISVHTARRHAEQLLKKLGVRTRAAVPLKLLG